MRQGFVGLCVLLLAASQAWAGTAVVDWKDGVQVLSAPGPRAKRVAHLPPRTEVETLEERAGWVHVRYRDGDGWVTRRSLRPTAEAASRRPEAPRQAESPAPRVELAEKPRTTSPPEAAPPPPAVPPLPAPALATPAPVPGSTSSPAPSPAPAAEPGGYLSRFDQEPAPKADGGPGVFSALSALLLVLAVVAGAVWLFRAFTGRRSYGSSRGRGIQILATRALGPRQGLVLVEVGGLPLLLAQGEGGVHLLAEIRDPEALRRLNDLYGFRETPFEAELHRQLDLEGNEEGSGFVEGPPPAAARRTGPEPTAEERLAALRRRRKAGEES